MPRQPGVSFDDAKTNTRTERVRVTDLITLFKWPERKWVTVRFHPELHSYAMAWVKGKTKEGKEVKFPAHMRSYDPSTMEFDSTVYDPWNDLFLSEKDKKQDERVIQVSRKFYGNMIVRKLQSQMPNVLPKATPEEKQSGFKDKDSETWTCWSGFALPPGAIRKIQDLKGLNTVTSKKTDRTKEYSVTDIDFGCDVKILYDPDKPPATQYEVQLGERTPLTDEELNDLRWDTSILAPDIPDEATVKKDYEQWAERMGRIKKSSGKSRPIEDDDGDGFEDDPAPKRTRRAEPDDDETIDAPPKRKQRVEVDIEDDDIPPPPKRAKRPAEDDDAFGEDEPPKRAKRPAAVEDDGFDDEPAAKPKRRAAAVEDDDDAAPPKRAAGKKKPAVVEDDDDLPAIDADEIDDDPLGDDEPAPPKRTRRAEPDDEPDDEPAPPKRRR
jgi:hypothetical protein